MSSAGALNILNEHQEGDTMQTMLMNEDDNDHCNNDADDWVDNNCDCAHDCEE